MFGISVRSGAFPVVGRVASWLLPVLRLICCCYGVTARVREAETAPCTQMCPGSTVGALRDMKHSICLSGHTLFSSQKAATQQGANLLLQLGGEGGGWGITTTVLCVPQLLHRLQTIFHFNIRMSLFFMFGSERVMERVFLGGFHLGSRSSPASGTQTGRIGWFLIATENQECILLAVVKETMTLM